MEKIIAERVNRWKKKLIDLTKRNRLISFRATKVTTIRIVDEHPPEVFTMLVTNGKSMDFLFLPEGENEGKEEGNEEKVAIGSKRFEGYDRNKLAEKHTDTHLQTNLSEEQLAKNLFRINSSAKSVMEEQGYNVLFLALGFLEWYESPSSDIKLKSPLILVPVEISRPSVKGVYKVKYNEDSILMNPALKQKLQLDFGINIDDLEDDIEKIDLLKIFSDIQKKIEHKERWGITNDVFLGLFSFAKFMMYKDLEANLQSILVNEIIQTICGQELQKRESLDSLCSWEELKKSTKAQNIFQVLDADSSQQRAIAVVKKGHNLVIEGPPGTGKSQTIANIIAEFIAEGKKVLFVSQKMAALEVVKKRLEVAGLGDFCLELHSRKTNKKRVIEELAENSKKSKHPDHSHDKDLSKLERLKGELNVYAKDLKTNFGELGMTPYKAMGIIASMPEMQDLEFLFEDVERWDEKKYELSYDLLDRLSKNLINIGNPALHPWCGARLTELSYKEKLSVKEFMDSAHEAHLKLQNSLQKLAKASCFKKPSSYLEIGKVLDGTNVLVMIPLSAIEFLNIKKWGKLSLEMSEILTNVKEFNLFKEWIQNRYDLGILEEDLDKLLGEYSHFSSNLFYFLTPSFRKNKRILKKYLIKNYFPKPREIIDDLKKILGGKKWAQKIDYYGELGQKLFGNLWRNRDSSWEELNNFSEWIERFHKHFEEDNFSEHIFDKVSKKELNMNEIKILREDVIKNKNYYKDLIDKLFQSVRLDATEGVGDAIERVSLEELDKKIKKMKESIDNIDPWLEYQRALEKCEEFDLGDFLDVCKELNISYENISNTFKCQFLRCWLDSAFFDRKSLKQFLGINHEQVIEQFRELDCKQMELAKVRIRHKLSGSVDASWEGAASSEIGLLQRESHKRRAHKSLRKLFKEIPNVLRELKPCLMMSPLTVAQLLDPKLFSFDLVIFDEASQIPPEDSIGAILRGKKVVVAGDTRQLPPTSFFQSAVLTPEDDEDELEELIPVDLDSILDECASSNFPECMLEWHYRSRHEHLIAFSNKHLYGNSLHTFPSKEHKSDTLGIKFHYLPGTHYERGKVGANFDEAREVAKAVFAHFKEHPDKSLGVGTFSIRQKFAIEDAIEELRKQDLSMEEFFLEDKEEQFFIKNLETIQGDERDVIFISVGYGKNASGVLPMNFGPLNQLGGERRLNVLITRARFRLEVFSSIRGSDFDLSKTNSEGVHLLKKYLDFAERGEIALLQNINEDSESIADSLFEEAVCNALTRKGIKVKKQIGCSGYKIDLAVVDRENPGEFLLGIECDGATYHSSKTARDRDRLRQQILEQLGWDIYRIWSTDWFKNPKQELMKVLEVIKKAQEGSLKKKVCVKREYNIIYSVSEDKHSNEANCVIPYSITCVSDTYDSDSFYYTQTKNLASKLRLVVETEGPLHKKEAMRRVSQFWGLGSVGIKIRTRLQEVERYCKDKKHIKVVGKFYWPIDLKIPQVRRRDEVDGISKKIDVIAPEEIREAALLVLSKEYAMPMDALANQTAGVFGYKRVTEDMSKYIIKSINMYKSSHHIIEKDGKVMLDKVEVSKE